jgi:nucleoside phosphorylase
MVNRQIDIGIITIIEEEFLAVLGEFGDPIEIVSGRREYNLYRTEGYDVAVVRCLKQGNAEAQSVAHDIIADLKPQWLLVVGIAGGAASTDFTLGDVIISTHVYDFSVEAALQDGIREFSLDGGPLHRVAGPKVANLKARQKDLEGWNAIEHLGVERPGATWTDDALYGTDEVRTKVRHVLGHHFSAAPRPPLFKAGHVASSDRLLKDTELLSVWQRCARHIAVIEMESAGVAKAAHGHDIPFVAIRGISDIVGLKRSPAWAEYACRTAAAFTRAFLRTRPCPPRSGTFGTNSSGSSAAKAPTSPMAMITGSMNRQPVSRHNNEKTSLGADDEFASVTSVAPSEQPQRMHERRRLVSAVLDHFLNTGEFPTQRAFELQYGHQLVQGELGDEGLLTHVPRGENRPQIRPSLRGLAILPHEKAHQIIEAGDRLLAGMKRAYRSDDGDRKRWGLQDLLSLCEGLTEQDARRAVPFLLDLTVWAMLPDIYAVTPGQLAQSVLDCPSLSFKVREIQRSLRISESSDFGSLAGSRVDSELHQRELLFGSSSKIMPPRVERSASAPDKLPTEVSHYQRDRLVELLLECHVLLERRPV